MGVVNGGINQTHYNHIEASLQNFVARYQQGVQNPPQLGVAQHIENVANSTNRNYRITVTQDVHTHAPYQPTTNWFTFILEDGVNNPLEFHIFVDMTLWPHVLLYTRLSNAVEPLIPVDPIPAIGSYTDTLVPGLIWFR